MDVASMEKLFLSSPDLQVRRVNRPAGPEKLERRVLMGVRVSAGYCAGCCGLSTPRLAGAAVHHDPAHRGRESADLRGGDLGGIDSALGSVTSSTSAGPLWAKASR